MLEDIEDLSDDEMDIQLTWDIRRLVLEPGVEYLYSYLL